MIRVVTAGTLAVVTSLACGGQVVSGSPSTEAPLEETSVTEGDGARPVSSIVDAADGAPRQVVDSSEGAAVVGREEGGDPPPPPRYEFLVNGRKMAASLYTAGDLGRQESTTVVADFPSFILALDQPGSYTLRRPRSDDRIHLVGEDGSESIIWRRSEGRLDPNELKTLRGLRIERWSKELEAALGDADLSRLCLSLSAKASAKGYGSVIPPLPSGLRCLSLTDFRTASGLDRFPQLRYFSMLNYRTPFDASWVAQNKELRVLRLHIASASIENAEVIATLPNLHTAELRGFKINDIGFLAGAPQLRVLSLLRVVDLSPIASLPRIERVYADMAGVKTLPSEEIPTLRELRILDHEVPPEQLEGFRRANPGCRVVHALNSTLGDALRRANRLRVRSGCLHWGHNSPADERTLIEVTEEAELREFIDNFAVEEVIELANWNGCTTKTLEFYRDEELLSEVSFSEAIWIAQSPDWPGDIYLTRATARFLLSWFARHGVRLEPELRP